MPKNVLSEIKTIHLIGICGTAMGSVAVMLQEQGYKITGSDANIYPPMSTFLESNKVQLMEGYREENLSHRPDLVIVGNAISRGNPELEAVLNQHLFYLSLPETLRLFLLSKTKNLVVTGTHGKTTTTSLLAWIFEHCGKNPSYLIGGVPKNLPQGCKNQNGPFWILEGDEYDTCFFDKRSKFLHYLPELVILNNLEFDHADIFNSLEDIKATFSRLIHIVPQNGIVVANADDKNVKDVLRNAKSEVISVGFSSESNHQITGSQVTSNGTIFQFMGESFFLPMYGSHNVHNACMAITAANVYDIKLTMIAQALTQFKGIKRRMEVRGEARDIIIIDDFAHHPTAIQETLSALKAKYPNRRLCALFEPRSNTTRRANFQDQLPEALALADYIGIGEVSRLDQLPRENRLDPKKVVSDLLEAGKTSYYEPDVSIMIDRLTRELRAADVLVVLSNGSFGGLIQTLLNRLEAGP
ncbi:MAG: UDP-N-acetylmuramate:L-alanyl-gamma-D-glutamyl-meso-diaminopimelate ligase [Verrucomicrobiota bacterium]